MQPFKATFKNKKDSSTFEGMVIHLSTELIPNEGIRPLVWYLNKDNKLDWIGFREYEITKIDDTTNKPIFNIYT
ncbi:hypothetical protein SAE01_07660 [Segetibacter aerophilus]|uniref:Uncharacterized protein n=1 Tax=Segetibacter aerophilus TaxID=670293 RepID=A0A512B8I7_9BACT|nr:hypothetical protein SAE01_07660 [Segetibacter aerophilus]